MVSLVLTVVLAAPATARLDYQRPEELVQCPDEAALRAQVAARLGREPFDAAAARTVRVRYAQLEQTLTASIEWLEADQVPSGKRTLSAALQDGCRELARKVELAVALMLDLAVPEPPPRTPLAAVEPPKPAAPPPAPPVAPEAFFGAGPRFAFGLLPAFALGGAISGGLRGPLWSVELEGHALGSPGVLLSGASLAGGFFAGAARACVRTTYVGACPHVTVGALSIDSTTSSQTARVVAPQIVLGARAFAELSLPVRTVSVQAWGEFGVALITHRYRLSGVQVWQTPSITGAFGVTLIWAPHFDGKAPSGQQ